MNAEVAPPRQLRAAVLAAALDRRPAGYPDPQALPVAAAPYAAEVAKFDTLLREITAEEWAVRVLGEMTAKQLVEHLTANDISLAATLQVRASVEDPVQSPPNPAHRAWRASAFALLRHALGAGLDDVIEMAGLRMPIRSAYLGRAFETWIHGDDIRLRVGRQADPPAPQHLHPLADLHVRSLPIALRLSGRGQPGRSAHVILTGHGGGEWLIPLGAGPAGRSPDGPDVTITADVLEFCYLAANRRSLDAVPHTVTGDPALAADLFAVMTFFSHE